MEQLDLIGQTSELARLFGVQFIEVLTRGTQFRVESLMLRLTKRRNNVPVSPNIQVKILQYMLIDLKSVQFCSNFI